MEKKGCLHVQNFMFRFVLIIFSAFTVYLIFMGTFYWDGGSTAYAQTPVFLRGFEMLAGTGLLLFLLLKWIYRLDEGRLLAVSVICGAVMAALQFVYVAAAGAGLRYDALKVVDEALALFSQPGIGKDDLGGYFARYSNNYAMTIMTHWMIKAFHAIGVIKSDFSNAVPVLQFVNIMFVDAAFAGAWAFLKKYAGVKAGAVFMIYMACNPLSYVWLPFYYTNTCSMAFAIWGAWLLFCALDQRMTDGTAQTGGIIRRYVYAALAGVLFTVGFEIRATVAIALIAALLTLACTCRYCKNRLTLFEAGLILLTLLLAMAVTKIMYQGIEDRYVTFDESDTQFPLTHWIAMGLSDTGTFSPVDEAYTMSFDTQEEKKEADAALIYERAFSLGPAGVAKLYIKKLALTFADGAGGYHSELNRSRDYGLLWQIVYGVYRDPLLTVTQLFYLLSLFGGLWTAGCLWKNQCSRRLFFLPLFLLGSYLFQMLWEAGTIYSIGTMYINGCMTALAGIFAAKKGVAKKMAVTGTKRNLRIAAEAGSVALCFAGFGMLLSEFLTTSYVEVSMSVDQFLYEANEYIALSDGMELRQTFTTGKAFSTIALQVHNVEGEYNDSVYRVCLYDAEDNLIGEQFLNGSEAADYTFYPLHLENAEGVTDYELRINKLSGKNDLTFLYYDTGHYDVYPGGRLDGLTGDTMADLSFEVYWREEE